LLSIARGGTNSSATPTAGGVGYGTGSAHAYSAAGTSGQALLSGGAGSPTWGTLGVASGGTGLINLTTNYIPYGNGTSAFQSGSGLQYNGTTFSVGNSASSWASPFSVVSQIGNNSITSSGIGDARFFCNTYYDGSNYKYVGTGYGSAYEQASGAHYWYYYGTGSANNSISTNVNTMSLDTSGNITIAGSTATKASGTTWANPSDTRIKNNQQFYTKGLTELMQIQVKTWTYNGLGGSIKGLNSVGVIADEIQSILPDSVDTYSAKLNSDDLENTDIKRFNASEIIWLLVKSVQELKTKLNEAQIAGF